MKRFTITIGREFGCGAREIGRRVASEFGLHFYDKELVDLAAKRAGVNNDFFSSTDEESFIKNDFTNEFGYGVSKNFYTANAIEAQGWVIRSIANKESRDRKSVV